MFSAPTDFRHLEGLKLGPEGVQMVNNIDPVLLKFIDHAGLKIEDMREEQLKKVEEIALENGILGRLSSEKKKGIMSKPSILPPSPKPPTHRPPTRVRQPPSTRPPPSSPAPTRPTRPPGSNASSSPSRRAGSPSTLPAPRLSGYLLLPNEFAQQVPFFYLCH